MGKIWGKIMSANTRRVYVLSLYIQAGDGIFLGKEGVGGKNSMELQ